VIAYSNNSSSQQHQGDGAGKRLYPKYLAVRRAGAEHAGNDDAGEKENLDRVSSLIARRTATS
jgi:hypothetical protein